MKTLKLIGLMCLIANALFSQGTVRGKVTDDLGETVIGATIVFKDNPGQGTVTDFDGNYSLDVKSSDPATLLVSFIGFQTQEATVNPKGGEVLIRNFDLLPENFEMNEVVIEAKANRAGDFYMEKVKRNAASSIDYISSETIRKIGDTNVNAAVKRVTGVSTVGSFITVRGLADRYLLSTVNGNRIPTLDPFTNNLRLDIFPTGLIDNLVITKTGDPELPGSWSGAYISIETKDYPDKFTLSTRTSVGFNSQSTGKEILTSEGSDTDWLGFDNGFRDIPEGVPTTQSEFPRLVNPNLYNEFNFLGLDDYLANLGITEQTPIPTGGSLHQLGLIQLDYLGAAQFNNGTAVAEAIKTYDLENPDSYFFPIFNRQLEQIGTSFNNTWFAVTKKAPVNLSQSFSIGDQTKLFGKTLGVIGGFRYSSSYRFDPNGKLNRTNVRSEQVGEGQDVRAVTAFDQQLSRETHGVSALLKLSYKLNSNNSVSLMFMPNLLGINSVRRYQGRDTEVASDEVVFGDDQFYEERQQLTYQYKSEHYVPSSRIKINLDASFTDGQRNVLDFKDTQYIQEVGNTLFRSTFRPDRRYRYMNDDMLDSRLSVKIPLGSEGIKSFLTVGGGYLYNERKNEQTIYSLQGIEVGQALEVPVEEVITRDRFFIPDSAARFDLYYTTAGTELDSDIGFRKIYSGFAKVDYQFGEKLRAVGGLRAEYTDIYQDILQYYEEDLPFDSPDRRLAAGSRVNPSSIEQWNFLPSINLIYKLIDDREAPMNLRVSYFHSIARPSVREISNMDLLDFELRGRVRGNRDLQITSIDNFDVRWEMYTRKRSLFSVTMFYKDFTDHIELIKVPGGDNFSWQNVPESYAFGLELESKFDIVNNLEFRGNVSFIWSETTITIPVKEVRPMFGQAPYIVNAMLTYDFEGLGLLASASYNVQGPKLAVVAGAGEAAPNIFELPRNVIDVNISKRLGEHFALGFKVRDILNNPIRRSYDYEAGYILDFDNVRWGTTYQFNVSYTI